MQRHPEAVNTEKLAFSGQPYHPRHEAQQDNADGTRRYQQRQDYPPEARRSPAAAEQPYHRKRRNDKQVELMHADREPRKIHYQQQLPASPHRIAHQCPSEHQADRESRQEQRHGVDFSLHGGIPGGVAPSQGQSGSKRHGCKSVSPPAPRHHAQHNENHR